MPSGEKEGKGEGEGQEDQRGEIIQNNTGEEYSFQNKNQMQVSRPFSRYIDENTQLVQTREEKGTTVVKTVTVTKQVKTTIINGQVVTSEEISNERKGFNHFGKRTKDGNLPDNEGGRYGPPKNEKDK